MRYPENLNENGTIGFIAPSFGCATEPYMSRFDEAIRHFHELGYKSVEGPNSRASLGIGKSNTPEACGKEINEFFTNDKCDVIISCGGGETMCEDLPFVDFEGIKNAAPKWYNGYSDNTNLTFLLPVLCDTAAIYGPCVGDFGMKPWHPSIQDAFDLLCGKKHSFKNYDGWEKSWPDRETEPTAPYYITEPYKQIIVGSDHASFRGRLLGGCLDVLANLVGTGFDKVKEFNEKYKEDGIIWFLESCDLNVMSMRRALWNLGEAGWFDNAAGFIIGRPLQYEDNFDGFTYFEAYSDYLGKYNVPIVMDLDLGHLSPMIPVVSGALGEVSAKGNEFSINYIFE